MYTFPKKVIKDMKAVAKERGLGALAQISRVNKLPKHITIGL